jgi:hypothetical protein
MRNNLKDIWKESWTNFKRWLKCELDWDGRRLYKVNFISIWIDFDWNEWIYRVHCWGWCADSDVMWIVSDSVDSGTQNWHLR